MSPSAVFLALLPLILIFILLMVKNAPADVAGLCGFLTTVAISFFYCDTPMDVILLAAVSGVVASLPISLAIAASAFQVTIMAETGSLTRIISFIKTIAPTEKSIQVLLINCGVAILFTSFGAATISMFPPILVGLGYSTLAAIALPCIGYTGGCIYAMMGVPVVIFAQLAGVGLNEAGLMFAEVLPFMLVTVALASLWLTGGAQMLRKGFVPALVAGVISGLSAIPLARMGAVTLTGLVVGIVYSVVLLLFLRLRGQPVFLKEEQPAALAENAPERRFTLLAASSPWLLIIVFSILTNAPALPFFDLVFNQLAMPVEIIPGEPQKMRLFWQVYFWIPVATILCLPLLKITRATLVRALKKGMTRAPRPFVAIALFFGIASMYMYSGYNALWQAPGPDNNMVSVLSISAAQLLGQAYIVLAPFFGLLGGVLSGSQSAGIAMLTKIHLNVAVHIKASGPLIALFSALGSGLAGAVSPAKIMSAAAAIDNIGQEGAALRSMLGATLLVTLGTAFLAFIWNLYI